MNSRFRWRRGIALGLVLLGIGLAREARAILIDWDTLTWTAGSLLNSYDIDPDNPGNDITIQVTGDTTRFLANYPQITGNLTGGTVPSENSLQLFLDFSNKSQAITVSIAFLYPVGVDEVAYDLFDIDLSGTTYIDQISALSGNYNLGTPVGPSITGSADNAVTGSGTAQVIKIGRAHV